MVQDTQITTAAEVEASLIVHKAVEALNAAAEARAMGIEVQFTLQVREYPLQGMTEDIVAKASKTL